MAQNELRNQEMGRHEERVDHNVEQNQNLNLREKAHGIVTADQNSKIARIVYIVYFIFAGLEALLGVRVLLRLIGANPDNGFASFINALSGLFVAPFASLFQNPAYGTIVLEVTTMIAMLIYAVLAWVIGRLIWLTLSRTR
jgi:YggT family protein